MKKTGHSQFSWDVYSPNSPKKATEIARKLIDMFGGANEWNKLGVALYRSEKYGEAVEALEKADQMLDGKDRDHRPFLAMSHWQLGDKKAAEKYDNQYIAWFLSRRQGGGESEIPRRNGNAARSYCRRPTKTR